MSDLTTEQRLQRIEEKLGIEDGTDDLPTFDSYPMEAHFPVEDEYGAFYVDEDGDIWFDTEARKENQSVDNPETRVFQAQIYPNCLTLLKPPSNTLANSSRGRSL